MADPTARVYRCYGEDDRLLYVGMTTMPVADRLRNHRYASPWFGQVERVTATPKMPWDAARTLEADTIDSERPLHNKPRKRAPLPPITLEASA